MDSKHFAALSVYVCIWVVALLLPCSMSKYAKHSSFSVPSRAHAIQIVFASLLLQATYLDHATSIN